MEKGTIENLEYYHNNMHSRRKSYGYVSTLSPEIKIVHGKAMAEKRGFVANIKFIKPTKDIKVSGIYILKAFIEICAKEVFSELK